ncbi:Uncharacterised protein [Yersinia mollaretii]|uniref:Uncharacterized protein n=1 Tax=Yersinia mollaretii TaxID=33060 RepID=A0AA36LM40_YERMO|nr:Uncharacterised protein [Yersinia mollaretii]
MHGKKLMITLMPNNLHMQDCNRSHSTSRQDNLPKVMGTEHRNFSLLPQLLLLSMMNHWGSLEPYLDQKYKMKTALMQEQKLAFS